MTADNKSEIDRRATLGLIAAAPCLAPWRLSASAKADATPPTVAKRSIGKPVVDTHRHVIGPKLAAKMAEVGLYDPKLPFPQTNPLDFVCYRDFVDLDYAMPKQRKAGVTLTYSIVTTDRYGRAVVMAWTGSVRNLWSKLDLFAICCDGGAIICQLLFSGKFAGMCFLHYTSLMGGIDLYDLTEPTYWRADDELASMALLS